LAVTQKGWKMCLRQVGREESLALLLLLLSRKLALALVLGLESNVLAVHLSDLESLELVHLERVQLLTREEWLLKQCDLSLRQLYQLWLASELKPTH
jgi:hypothetical protein